MSTSDETSQPATGGSGGATPNPGGMSDRVMLGIGAVLVALALGLIAIAIWSYSISHTKRGTVALVVAVAAGVGGAYVLVRGRKR